jgi:toxin ParE1/3/4
LKPYRFLAEAEAELHADVDYFDAQSPGLGDRFADDVDAAISSVREYPESGRRIGRYVRKRVLRVFKYNLLWVNHEDEIVIVAIAPHRRRPGYWRSRLRQLRR